MRQIDIDLTGAPSVTGTTKRVIDPYEGSYSLQEVDTGHKWIDGKKIYKRTFVDTASNGGAINTIGNIPDFGTKVRHNGSWLSGENRWYDYVADVYTGSGIGRCVWVTSVGEVQVYCGTSNAASGSRSGYVTIWYTKS